MISAPRVSVLMPVYNGACFLREAIDSIVCQTFPEFEFIIIDDGSTDSTLDILHDYRDSRIRVVSLEHAGLSAALTRGLELCRGSFIARMDADDVARADRLSVQVNFLDANPTIDIVCSDIATIDISGRITGSQKMQGLDNSILRESLLSRRSIKPIIHPSVIMRRRVIERLRCYRNFSYCEDHDFWLRAVDHFEFRRINQCLLYYRFHPGGVSRAKYTIQATNNCMSSVTYLVLKETGIDIFENQPGLYNDLSATAQIRLEEKILPAAKAFRSWREHMYPATYIAGYYDLAKILLRFGLMALPHHTQRHISVLIQDLVNTAKSRLNLQ